MHRAMISHEYKCSFIHIRKKAGNSIIRSFPETSDRGYGNDGTFDRKWHSSSYPGYLVFAVARNPWDRFISGWKWLCRQSYDRSGNLGPEYYRRTSLNKLLQELPEILPEKSHDRRHLLWSHLDMLVDKDGRFVADTVLRFETLASDYKVLCKQIGKPYSPLPHRKKGSNRSYWEYYDDETREMVGEMFREDIRYFGYKFGEPDSAVPGHEQRWRSAAASTTHRLFRELARPFATWRR